MLNYLLRPLPFFPSPLIGNLGTVGCPLCGIGFMCLLWRFLHCSAFPGPFHCQSSVWEVKAPLWKKQIFVVVAQYAAAADLFNQIFFLLCLFIIRNECKKKKTWRSVTLIHTDYAAIIINHSVLWVLYLDKNSKLPIWHTSSSRIRVQKLLSFMC